MRASSDRLNFKFTLLADSIQLALNGGLSHPCPRTGPVGPWMDVVSGLRVSIESVVNGGLGPWGLFFFSKKKNICVALLVYSGNTCVYSILDSETCIWLLSRTRTRTCMVTVSYHRWEEGKKTLPFYYRFKTLVLKLGAYVLLSSFCFM